MSRPENCLRLGPGAAGAAVGAGDVGQVAVSGSSMPFFSAYSSSRWSARKRLWQDWHSVSGSVKVATWPEASQTCARQDHRGVEADDVVAATAPSSATTGA